MFFYRIFGVLFVLLVGMFGFVYVVFLFFNVVFDIVEC